MLFLFSKIYASIIANDTQISIKREVVAVLPTWTAYEEWFYVS